MQLVTTAGKQNRRVAKNPIIEPSRGKKKKKKHSKREIHSSNLIYDISKTWNQSRSLWSYNIPKFCIQNFFWYTKTQKNKELKLLQHKYHNLKEISKSWSLPNLPCTRKSETSTQLKKKKKHKRELFSNSQTLEVTTQENTISNAKTNQNPQESNKRFENKEAAKEPGTKADFRTLIPYSSI